MTTTSTTDGLAGGQRRGLPDAGPVGGGMTRRQLVGLGWRMSVATPDGRSRLLLAGLGASLAMLVLLAGLAVVQARSAQQDRRDARVPAAVEQPPTDGLAVVADRSGFGGTTWFRGIPVDVITAVPIGTPPPPPGLDAFPRPGQIAASPAFARLHAADPLFAARYPGQVVATIEPEGLAGPNEVFAWIAVADARGTYDTSDFGLPEWQVQAQAGDRETADLMIPLGVLLFVLPMLILVGTSTRLGSAQRDQRMAAMRLVGATPGEVRLVSAAEAGGIAAVGVLGGLGLFAALRPLVGLLPWRPGLFPTDLAPPPLLVAALALALPVLGVAAGSLSQRRVVTSPLGVTRRAAPRAPRRWRLVPLAGGVVLLLVLLVFPNLIKADPTVVYVLLLGGAGLTLLGLVLATPLVGAMTATALLRWPPLPLAGQLGARRVQADPTSAGRLVTGTAVLVFIATWLLAAFLPVLNQASTGYLDRESTHLRPGTVSGWSRLDTVDQLRSLQGVSAVAPVLQAEPTQTTEEDNDWTGTPTIGDCAAISLLLAEPLPQCAPGTAYPIGAQPTDVPIRVIDPIDDRSIDIGQPSFDRVADYLGTEDGYALSAALMTLGLGGDYLLPAGNAPADLPTDWTVRMLVGTNGSPQAVESVKNVMAASSGTVPLTDDDQHHAGTSDQALYQLLLLAYLAAIGMIAVVSLAVTAADDLRNRARAIASLAAAGTPTRTLRRASLIQLLLTLLPAVALALATATIAAFMYSQLWLVDADPSTPRPFQPEVIAAVGGGSVLIVLAAYALTLPTLRNAVDLRGLRTT